jgi:CRP/FNR family transcriptional regulator, cyclic AMP receptor protein
MIMSTILVIEDNFDIQDNLCEFLELEGYRTQRANNGKTGFELARKFLPDLIICDVLMPIMDGYQVLQLLLATAITQNIPFVFSSSISEKVDRAVALRLGADDFITKPFELESLLAMVKVWVKSGRDRLAKRI